MRRLSLSTKLIAATMPLVIAVGGLLALTVRSDLDEIARAESGAELGGVWEPLIAALNAVEAEAGTLAGTGAADPTIRRATDQAINDLRASVEDLGAFEAASAHVTAGRSALSAARRNVDMATVAPTMVADIEPSEAYAAASREFVAVGQLLPSEAGDAQLGRELLAVVKLAETKLHANDVIDGTGQWPNAANDTTPLARARDAFASMVTTLGEFEAIAPEEWAAQFRQSGFNATLGSFNTSLSSVGRAADAGRIETFDTAAFNTFTDQVVDFERSISQSIVDRANIQADATRSATLRRIGIILAIVVLAAAIAWLITRSITRRVKAISRSANQVASEQLPALVEALRDPRGKAVLPAIAPLNAKGGDDLADLANAFNSMQATLIDVAHEQVEVLRRGVSDIFITMARRNRSLIDRQLSMLDEFEAGIDDHEILSNYYQLDHLATRMRRNSESLLVLANAEPKRRRVKATEIDDVVRASIGEVEDYRRIEIQHLESLQVRGTVVADISHLLAELLDNATSFSPPGSAVRVGGRRAGDSYMLRIVDDGVGIGPERLAELNELLREPPVVGLSVESTLGISVVSLLAHKHDIDVTLSAGSPGLTVDVILPSSLFGPMDAPAEQPVAPVVVDQQTEQIVSWNDQSNGAAASTAGPAPLTLSPEQDAASEPTIPADPFTPQPSLTEPAASGPTISADPFVPAATDGFTAPEPTGPITAPPAVAEPVTAAEPSNPSDPFVPTATEQYTAPEPTIVSEPVAPQPAVAEPVTAAEPSNPSFVSAASAEPTTPAPSTQPDASDWTKMSLDLSAFETSVSEPDPVTYVAPVTQPAPTLEPTIEPAPVPTGEAPPEPRIDLPPPPGARPEFNVPPAPPITANGPSQRPVTPATARPAPVPTPTVDPTPALPTRTQRGTGPEGPDRLAPSTSPNGNAPVTTSEPGALQAALAAFDNGRAAVRAPAAGELPTRDPAGDPVAAAYEDERAVTQSRVDPSALRDRLRAFQSEFSSATGEHTGGSDIYTDHDLGGDPR